MTETPATEIVYKHIHEAFPKELLKNLFSYVSFG